MSRDEFFKTVKEWPSVGGFHSLTHEQIMRKRKGLSIYQRDRVVAPYDVNKVEFV